MSGLEDLKKKLYQSKELPEKEKKIFVKKSSDEEKINIGWQEESVNKDGKRDGFKETLKRFNFTLAISIFSFIIIAVSSVFIYKWYSAKGEVSVDILGPTAVQNLTPVKYKAVVKNNLSATMKNVALTITSPEGAVFSKLSNARFLRFNLGDINVNQEASQNFEVIFLNKVDSVFNIDAEVQHQLEKISGDFQAKKSLIVEVVSETAKLNLNLPERIYISRPFSFEVEIKNTSEESLSDLEIKPNLPNDFTLTKTSEKIEDGFIKLPSIEPLESKILTFEGYFHDPRGGSREFSGELILNYGGLKTTIAETKSQAFIQSFPISLQISLVKGETSGRGEDYIVKPNDNLEYQIMYRNNETIELNDVIIKAYLDGKFFDLTKVSGKGFFSSVDNSITFNGGNTPELTVVSPFQQGFINFTLQTKETYPIAKLSDKDFKLKVSVELTTPTIPPNLGITDKLLRVTTAIENKIAGKITVIPKVYFNDPSGYIGNSGPMPLKVNQQTTFTAIFQFFTFGNSFRDITLRTYLPAGVTFTGKTAGALLYKSPPVYNDRTGELTFNIAGISANTGLLAKQQEAIFQIGLVPAVNQVGQVTSLLNDIYVTATDDFTGEQTSFTVLGKSSQLEDDPTVKERIIVTP